jgi:hypothetical protein
MTRYIALLRGINVGGNKKSTRVAIIVSVVLIVGAVLAACALGAGSQAENKGGLTLHETPQHYVLTGDDDSFKYMSSLTSLLFNC